MPRRGTGKETQGAAGAGAADPLADFAASCFRESIRVKESLLDPAILAAVARAARACIEALERGGQILLFGNGGSNNDAQHIAGEIVCRMRKDRRALPAMSLGLSTSQLTAIGNDIGFADVFRREVEAFARPGDVVVGISTSGRSENVLRGIDEARRRGAFTIALSGRGGGPLAERADLAIVVPSDDTARIQESHIAIGHVIADCVERHFLKSEN
ncbi:MAG: SIS domain-containing protein [Planctomycetes bacterium]|nr:SIS domain-containing protein [Planctomycetota bacterium]